MYKYYLFAILFALLFASNSYAGPREDAAAARGAAITEQTSAESRQTSVSAVSMTAHEYNNEYQVSMYAQHKADVQAEINGGSSDKSLGDTGVTVGNVSIIDGDFLMQQGDQYWADDDMVAANLKYIEAKPYFDDAKNFFTQSITDFNNASAHYNRAGQIIYTDEIFQANR